MSEIGIVSRRVCVHAIVIVPKSVGKAFLLAFTALSLVACDSGSALGSGAKGRTIAEASVSDRDARTFYAARQWKSAWQDDQQKQLLQIIEGASAHGLKPSLFLKAESLPEDPDAREQALTTAALKYAKALSQGYVDPKKTADIYTVPRPKAQLASGLAQAIDAGRLGEWFNSLAPQTDEYRALSKAFVATVGKVSNGQTVQIPGGAAIKPGSSDRRVPQIAEALVAGGYMQQPEAPPTRYTPALVDAVKSLQAGNGLEADGVVGKDTLALINFNPAGRARQLAVAMERARWLDREPAGTRIDVNTAATFLEYFRDGQRVDQRRVVVGEPGWETPQLGTPFFQLVANPNWRVPDSIYEDELRGKSRAYFASQNMQFRDGRLVQLPGPKNALGAVKFDLKNNQAIYLHDTPAKALFAEEERHRSHGCIRVQDALGFARMVASQEGISDKFEEGLASGKETYVKLKREIPVRLLYHTAYFDGSRIQYRADIYGWDDEVARGLGYEKGPIRQKSAHRKGADVGP